MGRIDGKGPVPDELADAIAIHVNAHNMSSVFQMVAETMVLLDPTGNTMRVMEYMVEGLEDVLGFTNLQRITRELAERSEVKLAEDE